MHARMQGLMAAEGLPYGRRTHTYNSRLAQELAKWADSQPGFEAIHDLLYKAYFVDGRNVGDPEVLICPPGYSGEPEFSPDGKLLAVGSAGGVHLFDVGRK